MSDQRLNRKHKTGFMLAVKLAVGVLLGCCVAVHAIEIDAERHQTPPDSTLLTAVAAPADDPWFGKDKFDHFLTSTFLVGLSYYYTNHQWQLKPTSARHISVGLTVSIGIGKEIWDKTTGKGFPSYRDLIADLLGVGLGYWIISWQQ
ncbi:hypothetical protein L0128_10560 [candidate division KSB1 bacterium]|nr:hypothetical protein [candidate division KSB1 bacterium]